MEKNEKHIGFFMSDPESADRDLANLKKRTDSYYEVLENTVEYRKTWVDSLRQMIEQSLTHMASVVGLKGEVVLHSKMENLEAIQFTLGSALSGMTEEVSKNVVRTLIKHNGSLVYQQLFNGKVMVVINFPFIEGYGQPAQPKTIAIYRPEEIKLPYLIRHMEEFVQAVLGWEDFDDEVVPQEGNQTIGFKLNFDQDQVPTHQE